MKRKTGVVVKVATDFICVRTVNGEFFNLKLQGNTPKIGDIYSGTISIPRPIIIKRLIFIAILAGVIIFGRHIYYYFSSSCSVIISIPPTIQLKVNKWNKIVSAEPTSTSGRKLLSELNLKNLPVTKGLELIVEEATRKNVINKNYIDSGHAITIYISGKTNQAINLTSFQSYTKDRKLNLQINNKGSDYVIE